MKPEEKVEALLWDWLKVNGKYIKEIYFNRKNELDAPIFQTKGLNKKPDFIVSFDRGYGTEHIALEIKNASSSKSVLDGGKIIDYYENYYLKKTRYFIDGKEIQINHFTIATQNSINGFLFNTDNKIINNLEHPSDTWRRTNAKYGLEPKCEYDETSRFQRNLWNQFRRLREKLNIKEGASLGLILSEIFFEGSTSKKPYLFVMRYNQMKNRKSKWGARFWRL